jgi:hypothetical protein
MATAVATGNTGGAGRAWRLLTTPAAEWQRIAAEPVTAPQVFRQWVIPFAAIGPLAGLIAGAAYGYKRLGFAYYPSLQHGIAGALATWLFTLGAVWLLALAVEALAPSFEATLDRAGAMKLVGYGATPAWLAGIFALIPHGGWLGWLGLYSLYVLWVGLPIVARPAENRRLPYFAVTLIGAAFAYLVVSLASAMVAGLASPPVLADAGTTTPVPLSAPSPSSTSPDFAAAAARAQARAAAETQKQQAGISVAQLQALLPAAVGGFTRRDLGGASGGKSVGSRADASYIQGEDSFTLTISDNGPPDPSLGAAATANLQTSRESATGFERTVTEGGQQVHERWDQATRAGAFETRVANRFTVSAQGTVASLDVLKQAAASVDKARLAALAGQK